jgi:hypothetical protein
MGLWLLRESETNRTCSDNRDSRDGSMRVHLNKTQSSSKVTEAKLREPRTR